MDKEYQIIEGIDMSYDNYHGYPFALAPERSQQFYLEFAEDEQVKAEVFVYWVDPDSTVKTPEFSEGERVEVSVTKAGSGQQIIRQEFLTATGILFLAQKNTRYILSFHNHRGNEVPKMLELAISYLHPIGEKHHGVNETLFDLERNTKTLQKEMLSKIHHTEKSMVLEEQMREKLRPCL